MEKTVVTFKGHPQDGGLFTGYDVLRDGQKIGFIDVCGIFRKNIDDVSLTADERRILREACKKIYEMPCEWGCLGVGESPTEPFEKFLSRTSIHHDLD